MAPSDTGVASTQVAILGGGIAGAWRGYGLAQQAVSMHLIAADVPPVSRRWAAAVIDVRLLDEAASTLLADSSEKQDPQLSEHLRTYAAYEFDELASGAWRRRCGCRLQADLDLLGVNAPAAQSHTGGGDGARRGTYDRASPDSRERGAR